MCSFSCGCAHWLASWIIGTYLKIFVGGGPWSQRQNIWISGKYVDWTFWSCWGMFFQDGLTGSAWGDWANYTDSPLRAEAAPDFSKDPRGKWSQILEVGEKWSNFEVIQRQCRLESAWFLGPCFFRHTAWHSLCQSHLAVWKELGVTPPLGFWDPLGFSKFENAEVHLEVGVFMAW